MRFNPWRRLFDRRRVVLVAVPPDSRKCHCCKQQILDGEAILLVDCRPTVQRMFEGPLATNDPTLTYQHYDHHLCIAACARRITALEVLEGAR